MTYAILLFFAFLAILIVIGSTLVTRADRGRIIDKQDRAELVARREFNRQMRDLVYQHRDLDSPLAAILTDEFNKHERELPQ